MLLSIIIPVYKMEPYLDACMQSVFRQVLDECEVILVDDCSPDNCGQMCDDWAKKDSRIKVLHCEKNGGLSVARNKGLEIATGEYVTFIDSDDCIAPNTLNDNIELLRANPQISVLEYPVHVFYGSSSKSYEFVPGAGEVITFEDWINTGGYIHSYAWNKIYKRELWKSRQFPAGRVMEDLFTVPYLIKEAGGIMRSNIGLYYYCDRKDSISNTVNIKNTEDFLEANIKLYNEIKDNPGISTVAVDEMYMRMCNVQIILLQLGGKKIIPSRRVSLGRVFDADFTTTMRVKSLMQWVLAGKYCNVVSGLRTVMKKLK